MILLVDLCYEKNSLSHYEFVQPIASHLISSGFVCKIMHFTDITRDALDLCDKIILCGTALKDNYYADRLELFSWLKDCDKPVFGICAGMQIISAVFGGKIVPRPSIGLERIKIIRDSPLLGEPREIEGYHLHNFGVTLPEDFLLLAGDQEAVEAFWHRVRPIFGIIFHPEVRNRWILARFAEL
jgi:GMP synthase-like glutamine amidotransferase